ncbi:MarR family winged helix-turn-helix transcriptional regulator [Cellulomonas sp. NPDC058312]|uniref:MarR family winged helix-turn-helix transcriptional regulator n=1 Tax=Cellulomonas sp. NPDC058312 TaxID=3346441 RepID=UPI0036E9B59B
MTTRRPLEQLRTAFALLDASALLQQAAERHLRAAGDLTYVQFRILVRLDATDRPALRMSELADGVLLSRSGLTYQVTALERRGLCTRAASPDDDRGVVATITDAGRALVDRLLPAHVEATRAAMLGDLTPEEEAVLLGVLDRAVRGVSAAGAVSAARGAATAPSAPRTRG